MTYSVETCVLKAAMLFVSTEHTRYYLNGIHIDPAGKIVALDGHRMFVGPLTGAPDKGFIIPRDVLKRVLTGNKRVSIEFDESQIDGQSYTPVDGTFPDWTRAVPRECNGEVAQFNLAFLGDFGKAQKILGGLNAVAVIHHNGGSGAGVSFSARDDCYGICMPVRESAVWSPGFGYDTAPAAKAP